MIGPPPLNLTDVLLSICKFLSIGLTGFFGVLALARPYRDSEGQLTKSGRIALCGAMVSLVVAAASQSLELERSHRQALAAQVKTQDEIARFDRLLHEVQRTAPLTSLKIKLTVDHVPNEIRDKVLKEINAALSSTDSDWFNDLDEHHNVDDEDTGSLIQSEMDRGVIQPFIGWLATGRFAKEQGILALALDNHFSALICIGWLKTAEAIPKTEDTNKIPSGVLVGDEIEWQLQRDASKKRKSDLRPTVKVEADHDSLTLSIELDGSSLDAALWRYSPSAITSAALPDDVKFLSWSRSRDETEPEAIEVDEDDQGVLPIDSTKVHSSVTYFDKEEDTAWLKQAPAWIRCLRLQIIPNGVEQLSKTYNLSLFSHGEPIEGIRADEVRGYVRIWHGHAP